MSAPVRLLDAWVIRHLEAVKDRDRVLLRDPLRLLPEADGTLHSFARREGFTIIVASTNLVFRELYEQASADSEVKKLLVIDRAPARRRLAPSVMKAPPPFYPDLLTLTAEEARIELDLRQFLKEKTGDPTWPAEVNEPRYARLIAQHLDGVLRAHQNLRVAHPGRFTDHDFKTIVACAALGVADAAFKKLAAEDYWKIGLLGHEALSELELLAPEVTKPIRDELGKAPKPFCWFADHEPELVVRAFYLSAILCQHFEHWGLLLANIDPALADLSGSPSDVLKADAPRLMLADVAGTVKDLEIVEDSLTRDNLQLLLLDQLKVNTPAGFAAVLERERYSTLFRSLALLCALDDLLAVQPAGGEQARVAGLLKGESRDPQGMFVEKRISISWSHLKEAYELAVQVRELKDTLASAIKSLKVAKREHLSFKVFRDLWADKKIGRLEYLASAAERLVHSGDFLPRPDADLPSAFVNVLDRIRQRVRTLVEEVGQLLNQANERYQEMVSAQYPAWAARDAGVRLTSQFLRRCLKPHWDPHTEKAVLFIFDGMRYDIWDEFLLPVFEGRAEVVADYPASALLPSETHLSRKAISAGAFPDSFDTNISEDKLLKEGLARELGCAVDVVVISPDSMGTAETVRYRAGNLDVFIFELSDKELHKIQMKTLPDGRQVPSRPLAFVYQQHLKNIIDTEVMAIVRGLQPGTKVFVAADHGFGRVYRDRVIIDAKWLNETTDCSYRNALLKQDLASANAPPKVRDNVWEFKVADLRMPATESAANPHTGGTWQKKYASIVFPKVGYSLARPGAHFNPDAYTHGGISIEEMLVPMVVLRIRDRDDGMLTLEEISGPKEAVEGEELEFRMRVKLPSAKQDELRLNIQASYALDPDQDPLPQQVLYLSGEGADIVYRFKPDTSSAAPDERRTGAMPRALTITASYRHEGRSYRKSRTHRFTVQLNSERVVRRVPTHLGNILGLTPKTMR